MSAKLLMPITVFLEHHFNVVLIKILGNARIMRQKIFFHKFSHARSTWRRRISEAVKNIGYAITPRGFSVLRAMGAGAPDYRKHKAMLSYPPGWMTAKDHFICLFVKK